MQAEIVDDVNAHTDKAIEAFAKKAQESNQSPFSPENINKLGSNHEYEKLNTLSKQFQNQLGTQHPLYPYYQFTPSQEYEGNLVSSPLRDDARKNTHLALCSTALLKLAMIKSMSCLLKL